MSYTIQEHIHRYGVWTAARAASKSHLSNKEMGSIIKLSGLKENLEQLKGQELNADIFLQWHHMQVDKINSAFIQLNLNAIPNKNMTYGIASKIIAIYIKTVEILPSLGNSQLSKYAHPPIDSILLKNIYHKHGIKETIHWSTFDQTQYLKAFQFLKSCNENKPLWFCESYWTLEESEEELIS